MIQMHTMAARVPGQHCLLLEGYRTHTKPAYTISSSYFHGYSHSRFHNISLISNCLFSSAKMKLNPASLISQECKRKDEEFITPTQYPTISGFSLAIFSVNGGIQLREMIEACTLPCKSVTVERWPAKKYTMKFLNFCHTKLTPNQLYVLTCGMAHFPSPLPTSMDTAIAEFQSTSISLSAIVFSLNSSSLTQTAAA